MDRNRMPSGTDMDVHKACRAPLICSGIRLERQPVSRKLPTWSQATLDQAGRIACSRSKASIIICKEKMEGTG
nr:hypothetical protein Xa7_IRBB7.48 [Oryza sativa Indica Group]